MIKQLEYENGGVHITSTPPPSLLPATGNPGMASSPAAPRGATARGTPRRSLK